MKVFTVNGRETHTDTKVLNDIKHTSFLFKGTLYLWLTKLCTDHVKYIEINLFTMTTIIHFLTKTYKLRSVIYDVHQERRGHENFGHFTDSCG